MADTNSPLFIRPDLSAIAIKYRQDNMVADEVMPRIKVEKQEFIHLADRMAEWITPPDTMVGRTGAPNMLSNSFEDPTQLATVNQGLDEPVPNQDQLNGPNESALGRATQRVVSLLELRREIRVAGMCATGANFTYTTTLSGTSQWSDYVNSDPVGTILPQLDIPFMRPNILVMSREVWTKLRAHPKILMAIFGAVKTGGLANREQVAGLFEVDKLVIGSGFYNSAAKGQTLAKTRIWGKHLVGFYQHALGGPDGGNTWAYTAQFGDRVAATYPDPKVGLFGGEWVRAGESVKEVIAAPEFAFQFLNAVA